MTGYLVTTEKQYKKERTRKPRTGEFRSRCGEHNVQFKNRKEMLRHIITEHL